MLDQSLIKKAILILSLYLGVILFGCTSHKAKQNSVNSQKTNKLLSVVNTGDGAYKVIEKLVAEGARTENIVLPVVWYMGDFECNSVLFILKNNLHLYNNKQSLNSKPKGVMNPTDSPLRREDLSFLSNTNHGKSICDKSIKLLVRSNPKLRNIQRVSDGSTALHQYLSDTSHPQWNLSIAKLLMSPQSINIQTYNNGNTPLHTLILDSPKPQATDLTLVTQMVIRGANIHLKNKYYYNALGKKVQGESVKELIIRKRPDLSSILKAK